MNNVKKYLTLLCLLMAWWMPITSAMAQRKGGVQYKVGGFVQPFYMGEIPVGGEEDDSRQIKHDFIMHRARVNFYGEAKTEGVSFFLDVDLTESSPLFDAWVAYEPFSFLKITFGQKLSFLHSRTQYGSEEKLQFADRNPLSENFTEGSGREFGLFFESHFSIADIILKPSAAVTSGDGRNSFGLDATDVDRGGFKYGGRFDILLLGDFKDKGDYYAADIAREKSPKLAVGGAYSFNDGVSGEKGDAHLISPLYDEDGNESLASYQKINGSLLFKWNGFSLLGEYVRTNVIADNLFIDPGASEAFVGGSISDKFVLGQALNFQMGYLFLLGLGIQGGYALMLPEFSEYISASEGGIQLRKETWYTGGISYYLKGEETFKVSLSGSYVQDTSAGEEKRDRIIVRVLTQIIF